MATFKFTLDGKEYSAEIEDSILREAMTQGSLKLVEPVTTATLRRMESSTIDFATLHDRARDGRLEEVLQPFDEMTFHLETGELVTAVCATVWPNCARFVFKDCYWMSCMNHDATNAGGYRDSEMRRCILEEIYPTLPKALRDIMAQVWLHETIDGERVSYSDPLFLLDVADVFGASESIRLRKEPDGFQLPIFERAIDRVKADVNGVPVWWWLRSVSATSTTLFRAVYTGGSHYHNSAYYSGGVAPSFEIV